MLRTSTVTEKVLTIRDLNIANRFNGLPESNTCLRPAGIDKIIEKVEIVKIFSDNLQYPVLQPVYVQLPAFLSEEQMSSSEHEGLTAKQATSFA